ncbi:MAG: tetratricopeptide repeat protein [Saprospiraceae bacterium]|nr:tetratricopeptide repeat protein [Saprospiraceae bacterium]
MKVVLSLVIIISLAITSTAQVNMNNGFQLLENGQFSEAEIYFSEILDNHPGNKTAQLCYGRAVGLSGAPNQAIYHFQQMEKEYPGDIEIRLNKAEAYLWADRSGEALVFFNDLYQTDSTNFAIVLGYANSLSIEKKYQEALDMIDRALYLNHNDQALISKKYILLGLTDQARKQGQYESGHQFLDSIELWNPQDRDVMLTRASLYLTEQKYGQAQEVYHHMLEESIDVLEASLGHSYTSMINQDHSTSIEMAENALLEAATGTDTSLLIRTIITKINALGAAKKFTEAHKTISQWEDQLGNTLVFDMARSRLYFWQGDFDRSSLIYKDLMDVYPDHYELRVSYAELQFAKKEYTDAINQLDHAISQDADRVDAWRLKQRIQQDIKPFFQVSAIDMNDNGGNQSREISLQYQFSKQTNISPFIQFNHKSTFQNKEAIAAKRTNLAAGINWNPHYKISGKALVGFQRSSSFLSNLNNNFITDLGLQYRLNAQQNIGVNLNISSLDYNSEMVRSKTSVMRLSGNYFTSIGQSWGLYVQSGFSKLSDDNTNQWAFLSFFHQLTALKGFKIGVNMSYLNYGDTDVDLYFSPESFKSGEVFIQYNSPAKINQRWSVTGELAYGTQGSSFIGWQDSFRWSGQLNYKISDNFNFMAGIKGSNTASDVASGYAYQSVFMSIKVNLGNGLAL